MTEIERTEFRQKVREGLDRSRYNLIRKKAMLNQFLIIADTNGEIQKVSARDLLKNVYNQDWRNL